MSTEIFPQCLDKLVAFLDQLQDRAPIEKLNELLSELDVCDRDLESFTCYGDTTYRRNLISQGPWYELLCICWKDGQASPIHNHANSTCGLRIVKGVCTETLFREESCGRLITKETTEYERGYVCTTQDADIHQISNQQGNGDCLITLHIYSPPLKTMDTYNLEGKLPNPLVPQNCCRDDD